MKPVKACGWLKNVLNIKQRNKIVNFLYKNLKPHVETFDAIAISGYSMALIAPIIAHRLKKEMIIVRKEREPCHSDLIFEGKENQKCIIIDDLVASGGTLSHINKNLKLHGCEIVGVALYHDSGPYFNTIKSMTGSEVLCYKKFY